MSVVGLSGCLNAGSDGDTGSTQNHSDQHRERGESLDGPVSRADVAMITDDGHHFVPRVVWIESGGTVTWTNESGSHTATSYHPEFDTPRRIPDGADAWNSGMFSESGATFEHTFDEAGVYDYFCVPHHHRAMVGSVVVGRPDPDAQPGLVTPQDDLPAEARELLSELNDHVTAALGPEKESPSRMDDRRLFTDAVTDGDYR